MWNSTRETPLFFQWQHLHRSDQNKSPSHAGPCLSRYNTKHNNPQQASHHPFYEKLEKVPDSTLKEMGVKLSPKRRSSGDPAHDLTVGVGKK